MPQHVQVGNDTLEFPDGMSDTDISAAIKKEYGGQSSTLTAPLPQVVAPPAKPVLAPDDNLGFQWGIKKPLDNAAIWAEHGINKLTGGHDHSAEDVYARDQARIADAAAQGRRPGGAGQFAGSVVASLPLTRVTRNPWMLGAAQGALNTDNPNDLLKVAGDTALGAGMGKVGDTAVKTVGAVIAPRINPLVRGLLNRGVELTPGQTLGGVAHRAEDAARSIFGLGDMVINAQNNANRSFARGAVQHTLDPIGEAIPHNIVDGHDQIAFAGNRLSNAYNHVLGDIDAVVPGRVSGVRADTAFGNNIRNLRNMAQGLGADQRNTYDQIIQQQVEPAFNPATGRATGRAFKTLDSYLGQQANNFSRSPNPYDRQLAGAIRQTQEELRDLVARQYPAHAQILTSINDGWARLVRVEAAARNVRGGNFTPEQLRQAVVQNAGGVRGRIAARGDALMQDYADSGSRVMSSTIPDSGTGIRTLATGAAGMALFGRNLHLQVNPWAVGALGAVSAPYVNRATGAITRAALSSRPAGAAAVRRGVQRVGEPLAALGTPLWARDALRDGDQ